jgi:hypothetical protein
MANEEADNDAVDSLIYDMGMPSKNQDCMDLGG